MRKQLPLFALILLGILPVFIKAQVTASAGLRAGANFSRQEIDEVLNADLKSMQGYYFSVPVEIRFGDHFALQPEVTFLQKGVQTTTYLEANGHQTSFTEATVRINYMETPLLLKVLLNTGDVSLFGQVGPSLAIALGGTRQVEQFFSDGEGMQSRTLSEEKLTFNSEDVEADKVSDLNYYRWDAGILFGGGIAAKAGPGQIVLEARYGLGLVNVAEPPQRANITNSGIGVLVGYQMALGETGQPIGNPTFY